MTGKKTPIAPTRSAHSLVGVLVPKKYPNVAFLN